MIRYNKILEDHPVDLQILGIGRNGHIGFNEPGHPLIVRPPVQLDDSTIEANSRFFDKIEDVPTQLFLWDCQYLSCEINCLVCLWESKSPSNQRYSRG